jgi:hypothetical protein
VLVKNGLLAVLCTGLLYLLYKACSLLGLPLYPYGMLFFLIPVIALFPVHQFLTHKQRTGYKNHLIALGIYSSSQLDQMTPNEIEQAWRDNQSKIRNQQAH